MTSGARGQPLKESELSLQISVFGCLSLLEGLVDYSLQVPDLSFRQLCSLAVIGFVAVEEAFMC